MDEDSDYEPQECNYKDNSSLSNTFEEECKALLNLADEFRSLGLHQEGFSFPSIVVVGDQSSGKSTLLEAISGVNLPKSDGLTTRCPLIISLRGTDESIWNGSISYFQLQTGEKIDKKIATQGDVCKAINEATEDALGRGTSISSEPMYLSVTAHGLPNLTLIDTPGIIHVAEIDQSEETLNTIRDMVKRLIAPENVIILVVMSAVRDIGTNVAIQYAKDVDKSASRTIGVVTKCDCVTTEQFKLVETINSNRYHITQVFFVAHLNRIREPLIRRGNAAQIELDYFKSQQGFRAVEESKLGVENLTKLLVRRLATSIKSELRKVNDSLHRKHDEVSGSLKELAPPPETDRASLQKHLMRNFSHLIRDLREIFETGFQGNAIESSENEQSLYGMWIDSFDKLETQMIKHMEGRFESGVFSSDVLQVYLEKNPIRAPRGFGNNPAFQKCVKDYVPTNEEFVMECLEKNREIIATYLVKFLKKYKDTYPSPVLMDNIKKTFENTFLACYKEATKSLKEYFAAESEKTKLNYWKSERQTDEKPVNMTDSCLSVLSNNLDKLPEVGNVVQSVVGAAIPSVISAATSGVGAAIPSVISAATSGVGAAIPSVISAASDVFQSIDSYANDSNETEIFRRELMSYLQALNSRVHSKVMDSVFIYMQSLFLNIIEQKLIDMSLVPYIVDLTRIEDVHQEKREQLESTFRRIQQGMKNFEKLNL